MRARVNNVSSLHYLLIFAFRQSLGIRVYLHTGSDGNLTFIPVFIKELLFDDDTALTAHTEQDLQHDRLLFAANLDCPFVYKNLIR